MPEIQGNQTDLEAIPRDIAMIPLLLCLLCALSGASSNSTINSQQAKQAPPYDERLITITGAIYLPLKVELHRRRIALTELIARAGGLSERAKGTVEVRHRGDNCPQPNKSGCGKPDTYEFTRLPRDDWGSGPFVVPGDQVFIPDHDYILVGGSVLRPSRYLMDKPIKVSEAIEVAGGAAGEAVAVAIVRCSEAHEGQAVRAISIPLNKLYRERAKEIYLGANDIVYLGSSGPAIITGLIVCPRVEDEGANLPFRVWD